MPCIAEIGGMAQKVGYLLWIMLLSVGTAVGMATIMPTHADEALYIHHPGAERRWISLENPDGARGAGGRENRGGHDKPYETIPPDRH